MLVKINNRLMFARKVRNVRKIKNGEYRVETTSNTYRIFGGRHAGGTRREWFLEGGDLSSPID